MAVKKDAGTTESPGNQSSTTDFSPGNTNKQMKSTESSANTNQASSRDKSNQNEGRSPSVSTNDKTTFELIPDSNWPPPIFMRKKDISIEERYYMEHRWYSQWSFFDKKANESKIRYHRLQWIIGIGAVTVPVLVGVPPNAFPELGTILYLLTVVISLAVAISTALENIYKYGDNWRSYRNAAEDMQQEKSLYDARAGRYLNNTVPFVRFVERTEEIIAQQNGRWIQTQEKQVQESEQRAQEFMDKFVEKESNSNDTPNG